MMSIITLVLASLACQVAPAGADDKAPFTLQATARFIRSEQHGDAPPPKGDVISVEIRVTENGKAGAVLSAPRLAMLDGSTAEIAVGETKAPATQTAAGQATPDAGADAAITSGLKISVIKPKGKGELLVVATMLKDGVVIWADSQWVKVEPLAD